MYVIVNKAHKALQMYLLIYVFIFCRFEVNLQSLHNVILLIINCNIMHQEINKDSLTGVYKDMNLISDGQSIHSFTSSLYDYQLVLNCSPCTSKFLYHHE